MKSFEEREALNEALAKKGQPTLRGYITKRSEPRDATWSEMAFHPNVDMFFPGSVVEGETSEGEAVTMSAKRLRDAGVDQSLLAKYLKSED